LIQSFHFYEEFKIRGEIMKIKRKALIIIDVQKAFDDKKWGKRNNLNAEKNISYILKLWREKGWLVIHVQHISDNPDSIFHPLHEGFAIKEIVKPIDKEVIFKKKVNSGFIGTNLNNYLKENSISQVVIVGLTTPHCVSTTTRMSNNLGFETYLITDATAAFDLKGQNDKYFDAETIHNISLVTLRDEFATLFSTKQLINNLIF